MSRRPPSIALPIFAMTVIAVLLTAVMLFVVTFRGPPPRAAPLQLDAVAKVLRDGRTPPRSEVPMTVAEGASTWNTPRHWQSDPRTAASLARTLGKPPSDVRVTVGEPQNTATEIRGPFSAGVRTPTGWRVLATRPPDFLSKWHWWTLQAMALTLLVLGLVAWAVARAITRPLARLAEAAEQGRVGTTLALPAGGPREVRALGEAVSAMQMRLAAHAENRTTMLAAIAHDLGTPLSRLAFWVEQLPEDARTRAAADIEEMRVMLGDVLRFAKDERSGDLTRIDLGSLLDSLADDLSVGGQPVSIDLGPRALVRGDSAALRRLFANLIENAVRYGQSARLSWTVIGNKAAIHVDDRGPGFDPTSSAQLFEPFVRGDPSRNRATGGTGLGLAIVRSIADVHGGEVTLGKGPDGGRVTVTLPTA